MHPEMKIVIEGISYFCEYRLSCKGETYLVPFNAEDGTGPYWSVSQFDSDFPVIVRMGEAQQ